MSEVGLRVRRNDGYIETTVTTKLTKVIGRYAIPLFDAVSSGSGSGRRYAAPEAANGGVTVDDFSGGEPFFYFLANGQKSFWGLLLPSVTISTNVISWAWVPAAVNQHVRAELEDQSTAGRDCVGGLILVYGVYS